MDWGDRSTCIGQDGSGKRPTWQVTKVAIGGVALDSLSRYNNGLWSVKGQLSVYSWKLLFA